MLEKIVKHWERNFRRAARADEYAVLRHHLKSLDLEFWYSSIPSPNLLLDGTIDLIRACSAYAIADGWDGNKFEQFLESQTYDFLDLPESNYVFTFDIFGKAFGRVVADCNSGPLDLADLCGHTWFDLELVGFLRFWISRIDGESLTGTELRQLQVDVRRDLYFDYTEEELQFSSDGSLNRSYLLVSVQEVDD